MVMIGLVSYWMNNNSGNLHLGPFTISGGRVNSGAQDMIYVLYPSPAILFPRIPRLPGPTHPPPKNAPKKTGPVNIWIFETHLVMRIEKWGIQHMTNIFEA
jgi:hypothetical protein